MLLSPEDKLILSSIKINPSTVDLGLINNLVAAIEDWDYLTKTSIDRGIAPLLFIKLPLLSTAGQIPEPVKIKLQQAYYKTLSRSAVLLEHFRKIAEAFTAHNIPVIALKGIYLSENLYHDIGLRQFSDIDLLVKPDDGEKCLAILFGMGFKAFETNVSEFVGTQTEIIHYPAMVLGGVSVEIHIKLHQSTEKYQLPVTELWNNAVPATISGMEVYTLNTTDLLIYLCLHLDKHFRGSKVQFTCFNDIANLLEEHNNDLDWPLLINLCQQYKCEEIVFEYILIVGKYMQVTVPDSVLRQYASLLTVEDEELFCKYLSGYSRYLTTVSSHLEKLNSFESFSEKFRYSWDNIFPQKEFMIAKYRVKYPALVIFYYPYRYYIGIKGFVSIVRKSLEKKTD